MRRFPVLSTSAGLLSTTAGKKLNEDKLAGRLEEAAKIMKSVFRYVFPVVADVLLTPCQ